MPNENDDEEEGDEAVVAIVAVVCRTISIKYLILNIQEDEWFVVTVADLFVFRLL